MEVDERWLWVDTECIHDGMESYVELLRQLDELAPGALAPTEVSTAHDAGVGRLDLAFGDVRLSWRTELASDWLDPAFWGLVQVPGHRRADGRDPCPGVVDRAAEPSRHRLREGRGARRRRAACDADLSRRTAVRPRRDRHSERPRRGDGGAGLDTQHRRRCRSIDSQLGLRQLAAGRRRPGGRHLNFHLEHR